MSSSMGSVGILGYPLLELHPLSHKEGGVLLVFGTVSRRIAPRGLSQRSVRMSPEHLRRIGGRQ